MSALSSWSPPLQVRHRHQLEDDSANPPDVLDEEGVISLSSGRELPTPAERFRHPDPEKGKNFGKWPSKLGAGILFPIRDVDGELTYHYRPDKARLRDGKPVKYEACAGARLALHVPIRVRPLLARREIPLWITEGAKKVYAGLGAHLAIIGLMGVDGFVTRVDKDHSEPLPDWDAIALDGRLVFIAFDSDVMTKPEVKGARDRLTRFLRSRGATVVPVTIPHGEDGQKVGLDDFLARGGSIDELMNAALIAAISATPARGTDGAQTCPTCPTLRAENAQLHVELGRTREREAGLRELRQSSAWSGKQRQVVEYLVDKAHTARAEGKTEVTLYLPKDGERSGTSAATVSAVTSRLKTISPDDLPFKIEDRPDQKSGHPRLVMTDINPYSRPGRDIAILARIPRPEKLGEHGGARRYCPEHPRATVILRKSWRCSECQTLIGRAEEHPIASPFHDETMPVPTLLARETDTPGTVGCATPRSGSPVPIKDRHFETNAQPEIPFHDETMDELADRRARAASAIPMRTVIDRHKRLDVRESDDPPDDDDPDAAPLPWWSA